MNFTNDLGLFVYVEDPFATQRSWVLAQFPYTTQLCMEAIRAKVPTDEIFNISGIGELNKDAIISVAKHLLRRPHELSDFYQQMQRAALFVKGDFPHEQLRLSRITQEINGLCFFFTKPSWPLSINGRIQPPEWYTGTKRGMFHPYPETLAVHSMSGGHLLIEVCSSMHGKSSILKLVDAEQMPAYLQLQLNKLVPILAEEMHKEPDDSLKTAGEKQSRGFHR